MRLFDFRRRAAAISDSSRRSAARALCLWIAVSLAGVALAQRPPQPIDGPEAISCQAAPSHTGELLVADDSGKPMHRLPLRHTEVAAQVSGSITHVTVEQRFQNPYAQSIEAVYTFPLPHEAAVSDLEIRIGDRIVRGEIRKRQEAREIYEQAKRDGRVAALLDQERPNIFTQSIANIMPGHEIVVRIQYIENLEYKDGGYELVFPTVVGPRFIPGAPVGGAITPAGVQPVGDDAHVGINPGAQSGTGWAADTDRVPDASRITPPVLPPGVRSGHDIGITVQLDAGVPLQDVRSENHAVDVERRGKSRATVALRSTDTIPNKDFVLRYEVAGRGPEFGWLTFRDPSQSADGYFSFVLQPEAEFTASQARPKEMVFLIDASGSMSGEPMAKVKAALRWALQHLNPDDTFQVIRFSESASPLSARPLPNTTENVQRALAYVERLRGQGGTHMRAGIEAALRPPADAERLRLVFFMTDGYIGNENEILGTVRSLIGDARLFAFGVGSSVNRFLLDRVAEEGRGVVDYVSLQADTREIVERFYARVAKPYLTDIEIDWDNVRVDDLLPTRMPDLFAGQPLVISGRYTQPARGTIIVRGKLGRRDFERRLRVQLPERDAQHGEVAVLWARKRIAALMSSMVQGEREQLVREVTDVALHFRLVSAYTSFVAVDNQVVNPDGKTTLVAQPVPMPEGVRYEGVFGAQDVGRARRFEKSASLRSPSLAYTMAPRLSNAPPPPASASPQSTPLTEEAEDLSQRPPLSGVARPAPVEGEPTVLPAQPSYELAVQPLKPRFAPGEDVRVRITLHNRGATELELPVSPDVRDGTLWVQVMLDGSKVPAPRRWQGTSSATLRLAPGTSHTWVVTLSGTGRYAFAVPGTYAIELRLPAALAPTVARCTIEVR
jgi:Ca-activated chloride channel family protein